MSLEQKLLQSAECTDRYSRESTRLLCSECKINVFYLVEMEGLLSPNEGRKGHRIYLWHGSQDSVVPASSAINSYSFLHQLLPPSASIYLDNKVPANHGLSSLHRGSPCGQRENRESFVERCNVSTVHRMLNHLFGPNQPLPEENQENGLETNLKGEVGFWSFSCVTLSILGYF